MGKPVRETASRTSTPPDPAPAPALKLKMFSKMTAKGRNQQAGGAEEEEKGGVQGAGAGGMTITKVRKSSPTPGMISLPGLPTTGPPPPSYSAAAAGPGLTPVPSGVSITPLPSGPKKIIRPGRATQNPCSIHCPGVTVWNSKVLYYAVLRNSSVLQGFPSLSCTACHCLFHPRCVAVPLSLAASKHHQFYCSDCQPATDPPVSSSHAPSQPTPTKPTTSQPTHGKPAPSQPTPSKPAPSQVQMSKPAPAPARKTESVKARAPAAPARPPPPRPFQGQTMINVAGRKFLVVPHPAPATLESPPPSPPPQPDAAPRNNQKLDVLLKPADPADRLPNFQVEEIGILLILRGYLKQ